MRQTGIRTIKLTVILLIFISGCRKPAQTEWYHPFSDRNWERFNILRFEIPINDAGESHNITLFAYLSSEYEYHELPFNMVMETPSGEERINEYLLQFRSKNGNLINQCTNDSCLVQVILKQGMRINKTGILVLEIENLNPRLLTTGVCGVGIRVTPSVY